VYKIAANAFIITGMVAENFEPVAIKPVQPVFGAKPYKMTAILQQADYGIVAESVLYLVMAEVILLCCSRFYQQHQHKQADNNRFSQWATLL
jgi:hypothetical protein